MASREAISGAIGAHIGDVSRRPRGRPIGVQAAESTDLALWPWICLAGRR